LNSFEYLIAIIKSSFMMYYIEQFVRNSIIGAGGSRTTSSTARGFTDQLCYGEKWVIDSFSFSMIILMNNRLHPCYNRPTIE
ncbi:hypothetical protein, partial [Latilactobacillus curvatus]|uniref:hypothetical protein n=1 Tax=Latilactobacillus curvatus TaxID=28038 RepID=UPI00223B85BD